MRKTYEELNTLKEQLQTDRLWSWSRKNCVHNSLYEYFLKYIKHEKEDRKDSIYVVTGGLCHDIIEKFYSGEITKDQMLDEFEYAWTAAYKISDLKFNRNDSERNNNIADKYYKDLKCFFKDHNEITDEIALEQFVIAKVGQEYFQGYIDAMTVDKNGKYSIIDWKTSTIYLGEKAKNECGQLVLYAMALNQNGIPYEDIRIGWNFLKYVNVYVEKPEYINLKWITAKGEEKIKEKLNKSKLADTLKASVKALLKAEGFDKNDIEKIIEKMIESNSIEMLPQEVKSKIYIEQIESEVKPRRIERSLLGEELQANVKAQMKRLEYSEDEIFEYLDALIQSNDINCLPENVRNKYTIEDCYVYVELTEELLKHWETDIIETLKMIREKEAEYEKTKDESIWMESIEDVENNSFYFANLCAYSANKHKPYKLYLEKLEAEKNGNIFSDKVDQNENEEYEIEDLSWLNGLN